MSKRKVVSRRVRIRTRNRITIHRVVMEAARLQPGHVLAWDLREGGGLIGTRVRNRAKNA
jgi:hypothetical protein